MDQDHRTVIQTHQDRRKIVTMSELDYTRLGPYQIKTPPDQAHGASTTVKTRPHKDYISKITIDQDFDWTQKWKTLTKTDLDH